MTTLQHCVCGSVSLVYALYVFSALLKCQVDAEMGGSGLIVRTLLRYD